MSKVVYTAETESFSWRYVLPWSILNDITRHRTLIAAMVIRDFRGAYQASYLGFFWQFALPMIMLAIFYFVFGQIFGGKFLNNGTETPIDYALALFVGLAFFNFLAQNIGNATSLITSNVSHVKTMLFPIEILSVNSVIGTLINLVIGLSLTFLVLLLAKGGIHASAVCVPFYVLCIFLLALGVSWGLSALAVFIRDVSAITSPLTLILMFMCPIFYPKSMVPKKVLWVIEINPLAIIIEDARSSLLYGTWPDPLSAVTIFLISLAVASGGYFFFMRSKSAFADVM